MTVFLPRTGIDSASGSHAGCFFVAVARLGMTCKRRADTALNSWMGEPSAQMANMSTGWIACSTDTISRMGPPRDSSAMTSSRSEARRRDGAHRNGCASIAASRRVVLTDRAFAGSSTGLARSVQELAALML